MLILPNVSLVVADCVHPERSLKVIHLSLRQIRFASTIFVTDMSNHMVVKKANDWGIKMFHCVTIDRADHEYTVLENLPKWFNSDLCLFQEWDSAVMNPRAWDNRWLTADYIGAPWPPGAEDKVGWDRPLLSKSEGMAAPKVGRDGWGSVGNGGFSLRSKAFCEFVAKRVNRRDRHQECSDAWMCRTLRTEAEKAGLKYADESDAEVFSCENRFYAGQFGMHGIHTIKMNGFDWSLDWLL